MKNKKMITVSLCIAVALMMFAGCGENSGEKEYTKAVEAWKSGDLVRARSLFDKSISKSSGGAKKSTALNQLGLVLWELSKTKDAAKSFNEAANLSESLSGASLNSGIALYHCGQMDEAELVLNNVIGENPKNDTALAILGLIELQKRNWTGATQELSKSANINPRNPAAQNALALAELHQTQQTEQAITRLKQIISAYPDYAPAAFNLGSIYDHWLSNSSAAMGWYKQYLEKAGADGSHILTASQAVVRLGGQPAERTTAPQTEPKINQADAARYMAEGTRLQEAGKFNEAIAAYRKALISSPKQKNAFYNMGVAFYALSNFSDAASACNNALNIDPDFANARYMLALAYAKQKKWNDAARESKELAKTDPKRGQQMIDYVAASRKR